MNKDSRSISSEFWDLNTFVQLNISNLLELHVVEKETNLLFVDFEFLLQTLALSQLIINKLGSTPTIESGLTETPTKVAIK